MSDFNPNSLQQFNDCLANVKELAGGPIGLERLDLLMQFCDLRSSSSELAHGEMFSEVKAAGIELTPGLKRLVKSSSPQNVINALTNYIKVYGKGGGNNPANLFYRILQNENLRRSDVQV